MRQEKVFSTNLTNMEIAFVTTEFIYIRKIKVQLMKWLDTLYL
jgi:hypothetical protein